MLVETISEFLEKHQKDGGRIRVGPDQFLFPDGAKMHNAVGLGPSTYDPPADETQCLALRLKYQELKLQLLMATFNKLAAVEAGADDVGIVNWHPSFGARPSFHYDGERTLDYLGQLLQKQREVVKTLTAEYQNRPEVVAKREAEEAQRRAEQQRQQAERARRNRVDKIRKKYLG